MDERTAYRIRVGATLGCEWTVWLGGLDIVPQPDGSTLLVGEVRDQAALHGVLGRLRDLAIPLIALEVADAGGEDVAMTRPGLETDPASQTHPKED